MNIDWNDLFLKPTGRIGQKEFWIGIAILFVVNCILTWVVQPINSTISNVIGIVLLYPSYCVLGSRFADFGKSAKLAMLPFALMGIGMLVAIIGGLIMGGSAVAGSDAGAVGGLGIAALGGFALIGGWILSIIFIIWAGVTKGDPGPNAYGPPPADPTAKAA